MTFLSWETLTTYTGSLAMVMIITELTKNIRGIRRLPTQLWSYFLALLVLYPAAYFTGMLSRAQAVLLLFHGAILALAANGGYAAVERIWGTLSKDR